MTTKTVYAAKKVSTDAAKLARIAVRGYAPDKKALARLMAAGLPKTKVYEADKGETWDKFTMRQGEYLGVVDGFRAFGGKRDMLKAVKRFHDNGATILDVETGQDSRAHGPAMHDDATKPRNPSSEYQRLTRDERADARRLKNEQMTKLQAHAVWFNPRLTTAEKEAITKWSRAALYKVFGPTGVPAGRPPKQTV